MPPLQTHAPLIDRGEDAPLPLGRERGPLRDFLDRPEAAAAETGRGVERADAGAGRDGRALAHVPYQGFGLWAGAGVPGAGAPGAGAGAGAAFGSRTSSSFVASAVPLEEPMP